jgi:Aspartyl protease
VGGKSSIDYVTVDDIKIGSRDFGRNTVFVAGPDGPGGPSDADVVVGMDVLSLADIEFDLAHGAIRLIKTKGCGEGDVVYWGSAYAMEKLQSTGKGGEHKVTVDINGHHIDAQLDSGAVMSVLSLEGAHFAGLTLPASAKREGASITGFGDKRLTPSVVKLDSFAFDQEKILNTPVTVADLFSANREVATGERLARNLMDFPEMLLGADFFWSHRIFLAKSEGKAYISYVGGPVFATDTPPGPAAGAPAN